VPHDFKLQLSLTKWIVNVHIFTAIATIAAGIFRRSLKWKFNSVVKARLAVIKVMELARSDFWFAQLIWTLHDKIIIKPRQVRCPSDMAEEGS